MMPVVEGLRVIGTDAGNAMDVGTVEDADPGMGACGATLWG